jgi:hypothetical protein
MAPACWVLRKTPPESTGAIGAQLTTSTFQAVGFYQKLGYAELGRLKDRPPGHDRIWMAKRWS